MAIASRDAARASEVADELGIPTAHGSYEALLGDPNVDAVYIPLPNHLHAEWAIAAARAGKHVLCEKPLALTAADAERMVDGRRGRGGAPDGGVHVPPPSVLGRRARARCIRSHRQLMPVQSWFSYFNDDPTNIRNIQAAGGGALYDIGCYCINLSRMLFAGEPTRVEGSILRDPASGVDILAAGLLEFDGGAATFTCSTRAEDDQQVHVYGTDGRISIGIPFNIPPDRPTHIYLTHGGDPPVAPATRDDHVRDGRPILRRGSCLRGRDPRRRTDAGAARGRGRKPACDRATFRGRCSPSTRPPVRPSR